MPKTKRLTYIQQSPGSGQCMLASAAMVLGVTIPILIQEIGHDGSEICWHSETPPHNQRGFHIQEILDCFLSRGLAFYQVDGYPLLNVIGHTPRPVYSDHEARFLRLIKGKPAMIYGTVMHGKHMVAWDGERVYDPSGSGLEHFDQLCHGFSITCAYVMCMSEVGVNVRSD